MLPHHHHHHHQHTHTHTNACSDSDLSEWQVIGQVLSRRMGVGRDVEEWEGLEIWSVDMSVWEENNTRARG